MSTADALHVGWKLYFVSGQHLGKIKNNSFNDIWLKSFFKKQSTVTLSWANFCHF